MSYVLGDNTIVAQYKTENVILKSTEEFSTLSLGSSGYLSWLESLWIDDSKKKYLMVVAAAHHEYKKQNMLKTKY